MWSGRVIQVMVQECLLGNDRTVVHLYICVCNSSSLCSVHAHISVQNLGLFSEPISF